MNLDLNLYKLKPSLRLKDSSAGRFIYDIIRKKWVALQPEEVVRQLLINYFLENKVYPRALIQVERTIRVNRLLKRFDVLIYDKEFQPFMIIEVKSHTCKLDQGTFDQVARYNIPLKAPYLMVTNGVSSFCAQIFHDEGKYEYLDQLPVLDQ